MTKVGNGDTVVFEVALNEHPLLVGDDDDRSDEELIAAVEERTYVSDPLSFPDWMVMVSYPPDDTRLRYVNTASRINVKAIYGEGVSGAHQTEPDVFDAIKRHLDIEDFGLAKASMSHWGATHIEDFEGEIHLDVTGW